MAVALTTRQSAGLLHSAELLREFKEEGIEKDEATVLTAKFGQLDETHRSHIEQASADELLVWAERILTADRIEEVFGD